MRALRFFLAARRSWTMRTVPTATVRRPPPTADSRIATPSGRFQFHPKKLMVIELVFCMMNTSSRIRIKNPPINADHRAAARVKWTAFRGGGAGSVGTPATSPAGGGTGSPGSGVAPRGRSGTDDSLVMGPSLPFQDTNETNRHYQPDYKARRVAAHVDRVRGSHAPRGLWVCRAVCRRHRRAIWRFSPRYLP